MRVLRSRRIYATEKSHKSSPPVRIAHERIIVSSILNRVRAFSE